MKNFKKRFILWIDDDLHETLKKEALKKKIPMAQLVREKLRTNVSRETI